jgi:hypothetical protein
MIQLQDSILERLHCHTFSNMLFNGTLEAHCAWILSCFSSGVSVWLIAWPIFWAFQLFSPFFFTTLCMWIGLPHPSIVGISQCVCTHPINLMGIHFLHCVHDNERTKTHDAIHDTFVAIVQDASSTWDKNNYMCFFQSHSSPLVDELTLCLPKMTFTPYLTLSLSTQCEQI